MTIYAFPDVRHAPSDVQTVSLDWTAFAPEGTTITAHSVKVRRIGDVTATDEGVDGMIQKVTLSGGTWPLHSVVEATVTFSDGTTLTRGFDVVVR